VHRNLSENDEAFPYVLDFKPGFFLSWVLYRLFKKAQLDKSIVETLKKLHRQGTVVYAIKYRGQLDFLLYHFRFRLARIPYPKVAFDLNMSLVLPMSRLFRIIRYHIRFFIENGRLPNPYETGFFKRQMESGEVGLICLVDPVGFSRRFIHAQKDNLAFLLETQKEMDRPVYIVPLLVLYKKTPEKESSRFFDILFGYKDNPGTLRKTVLFFRHHRQALIDFGAPLNLKEFFKRKDSDQSPDESVSSLRRELINRIDQQKRIILGPIMKSRQQMKEIVLTDPEIDRSLREMAAGKRRVLKKYRKKASEYFDEIAADYNIAYIQFFQVALRWLWKKLFEGIDVRESEMAALRESARKGALIYVPSHKSHIDYLVLNYILLEHHMHVPRVAAGRNLAFWPMGHIFRKSGAFFIRRTFQGARLYARVFTRYIKALLAERHPLEFFIEGGRSRSGKLILPKVGFLSILLEAFKEGYCEDLFFVPVSISYDRILEEKAYIRELSGLKKERETLFQMMRARRFLKRNYGKIYVRFAPPVSLREYLKTPPRSQQPLNQELGLDIIRSINRISLVTPISLVATAILARHRKGFNLLQLMETVKILLDCVRNQGIPLASSLTDQENAIREALAILVQWKVLTMVEATGEGGEAYYSADDEKKMKLAYYKNNIIHFFVPRSFGAISLLTSKEDAVGYESIAREYGYLRNLFRKEFVLERNPGTDEEIAQILEEFVADNYIHRYEDGVSFRITRRGLERLPIWGDQVKSFLESYWIAAKTLLDEGEKKVKKTDRLKNMENLALRFQKLGVISFPESISEINFRNALNFLEEEVLRAPAGEANTSPGNGKKRLAKLCEHLQALYQ
jgi:glycerol-3-phosphate O-acyltransferase